MKVDDVNDPQDRLLEELKNNDPVWRQVLRSIGVLKWAIVFTALLMLLPVLSWNAPTFRSIFGDLELVGALLSTFSLLGAALSVQFNASMQVHGAANRLLGGLTDHWGASYRGLHPRVDKVFCLPLSATQLILALLTATPGVVVFVVFSSARGAAILGVVAALLLATLMVFLFPVPLHLTRGAEQQAELGRVSRFLVRLLSPLRPLAVWLRQSASWWARKLRLESLLAKDEREVGQIAGPHYLALVCVTGLLVILVLFGLLFTPPYIEQPLDGERQFVLQTPFLVFVIITILVWVWGAVEYHAARFGAPPFVLLLLAVVGFGMLPLGGRPTFAVKVGTAKDLAPTDGNLKKGSQDRPRSLVVICGAGGGILASGWTALALQELEREGIVAPGEIRLLTAYFSSWLGVLLMDLT